MREEKKKEPAEEMIPSTDEPHSGREFVIVSPEGSRFSLRESYIENINRCCVLHHCFYAKLNVFNCCPVDQ